MATQIDRGECTGAAKAGAEAEHYDHGQALHAAVIPGKPEIDADGVITAAHWGIFRAKVEDGKLTGLAPFEHDASPSPNISRLAQLPYAAARIRYPMVREGFLKNGPASRERRGEEKFVRVSWETALDLVASEMKRVYAEYGPSAVFGHSYGWKSTGKVNAANTLQRRLLNLLGGYVKGDMDELLRALDAALASL